MDNPGGGDPPLDEDLFNENNINVDEIDGQFISNSPPNNNSSNTQEITPKPIIFYSCIDKGPYIVYMESTEKVGFNLGRANNIKIARDIFNLKLTDIKKINNKGLNRISIEFISYNAANLFVNNPTLLNKGYKIFIPFNFVTSKGIARRVDFDITEKELLECCNVDGNIEILSVKRLNRKVINDKVVSYEPTGTVLFTFKGVRLPRAVHFYNLSHNISVYVPPVTQCFRCLRYGHTRTNCKGKERCFNCGEPKHLEDNEEFTCSMSCYFCKEVHKSTSKICPEYNRQKNIKELMAFENLTFFEASESCKRSYIPRGEFVLNREDFPTVQSKSNINYSQRSSDTTYEPSERRNTSFKNNPTKRTFQQVVSSNPNKKRMIQKSFNKNIHDENLYNPNGRTANISHTSWISQQNSSSLNNITNSQPSTSAPSLIPNIQNVNLDAIINFLRNAPVEQTNILRSYLLSEPSCESYMSCDHGFA